MELLPTRIHSLNVLFGVAAIAAFWVAIQLCWSVSGRQWYSVTVRLMGALVLLGVGVVMIFFTAFGAG